MTSIVPHNAQKLAYRIDEAVKASGLGRSFLYERMADGSLKSVKIGGRRLILRDDLLRFLCGEIAVAVQDGGCNVKPIFEPQPKPPSQTGVMPIGHLELPCPE
jgi:excisionase family DNA binding protein